MTSPIPIPSPIVMHPVESSNIAAAGYDEAARKLVVRFATANLYAYTDVPPEVYKDFLSASSKGAFFARHIRGAFPYEKVS